MAYVYLVPNGEGLVQQWIIYPTDLPPVHWNKVDDDVGSPDEDSTYVHTSTSTDLEDFRHETSALLEGATIIRVRVVARLRLTGLTLSPYVNIGLRSIIGRYAAPSNNTMSGSYVDHYSDWSVNPWDDEPWEKSDIDSLQTSLQSFVTATTVRCTQIYLRVKYIPVVTPVAGKGLVSWTP